MIDWLYSNVWAVYAALLACSCLLLRWYRRRARRKGLDISEVDRRRRR